MADAGQQQDGDREVGRHYIPDQDLNENGIPDAQEREDYSVEFGSGAHINSPGTREDRFDRDYMAAHYDLQGSESGKKAVAAASAEAARIQDENERIPHKTGYSSGDLAKRIEKIRKKRIPKSSLGKELSRMPQNKSDAENGLEIGKHTWKGLVQGLMSSHKDAENARDARLAAELEEARDAQKQLDKAEAERAETEKAAREIGATKHGEPGADAGKDGSEGPGGAGPDGKGPDGAGPDGAGPAGPAGNDNASSDPKTGEAAPVAASAASSKVDGAKVTGEAGLGLATAAVNPVAGVAVAAVQANETQKKAGASHNEKAPEKQKSSKVDTAADVVKGMEARRNRTLGVAPKAPTAPNPDRLASPAPAAKVERKGKLFAQARSLPRPAQPTLSRGPSAPAPRVRAQGLGMGIGGFMKAVRSLAPATPEISAASWMQKQRDSEGLGR